MRMSAITASARDQSTPSVQDLIPERKKCLFCRSSQLIKVMLPLHYREACDFPILLKRVPVHPEMNERHSKLLHKPH